MGKRGYKPRPIADRFWEKVAFSGVSGACWEWRRHRNKDGYGVFALKKRQSMLAHRWAWERAYGPLPEGMEISHVVCDNPACVRPDHLRPLTHRDNMADMARKGRAGMHPIGERNPSAKLTAEKAAAIMARLLQGGKTQAEIGTEFGVNQRTVSTIWTGKAWSHIFNPNAGESNHE